MDDDVHSNREWDAHIVDDLLQVVNELVKEIHPLQAVTSLSLDSRFEKDLGLDSLARVELIARVEKTFQLSLPEREFAEAETPRDLLRAVLGAEEQSVDVARVELHEMSLGAASMVPQNAQTLNEVLAWYSLHYPDRPHIQMYADDGSGPVITYQELNQGAIKVAAGLQEFGLGQGEPVAIMLPSGAEYFYSFFGALLAGCVPVPIYPPGRPAQLEDHMRRHSAILNNCVSTMLITVRESKRIAQLLKTLVPCMQHIVSVSDLSASTGNYVKPTVNKNDTAFIQYTSGSTGSPKGVVLTHANLLANIRAMGQVVKAGPEDVFVSWLPLYHDMGLIGAWLGSLYHAALFVVMPPLSFLARPERWLWAIHRYRGTLSASPNFGYEFCLRRLQDEDIKNLDLSSWRAAMNGAEPVSPNTVTHFIERFSRYGFQQKAFMPVYGLAESSVGLAFPPLNRGPVIDYIDRDVFTRTGRATPVSNEVINALQFVSSGQPLPGHEVRVIDARGHELPERQEGVLQFMGPSSTSGYYHNAEKNVDLFKGEWLDSGDLAYMAGGEIYITGRVKDIVIRAGRNIYPHELEEAVGDVEGIRSGRVVVFGTVDQQSATERLVVLAETKSSEASIQQKLRAAINELATDIMGSPPDDIVLAPPGTVLKTSSGKIRRAACREMYERGEIGKKPKSSYWQLFRLTLAGIGPEIRRVMRYAKDWLFAAYSWCVYGALAPVVWFSVVLLPNIKMRWYVMSRCARMLGRATFTPVKINGLENIPARGTPVIYVSNHSSYLDGYVLSAFIPGPFKYVVKKELGERFIVRQPMKNIGGEFVDRFDPKESVNDIKQLSKVLQSGHTLMFFAEGTFSRIPGLMPFHLGAFMVAAEAGVPVIPIAIRGTRSMLRSGSWFPHRGAISVNIGSPIDTREIVSEKADTWQAALALRDQSRDYILRYCGEPDLESIEKVANE